MKDTLAQLFITGVGVAFLACLAIFALAGLYVMAKWAWELWSGWRTHVAPTRQAHAARLIDAEAEGWLETIEWPFPAPIESTAGPIEVIDEVHHWTAEEAERRFAKLRDLEVAA